MSPFGPSVSRLVRLPSTQPPFFLSFHSLARSLVPSNSMDQLRRSFLFRSLIFVFLLIHGARSFYLPRVAPEDFEKGHPLKVQVTKLTSIKTRLAYPYYSLPFCRPEKILDSAENLYRFILGDRIQNSLYEFKMRESKKCQVLCRLVLNAKHTKDLKEKIDGDYRVNMILENLPVVVPLQRVVLPLQRSDENSTPVYQLGFRVGLKGHYSGSKEEIYFIHNHLAFTVKYHRDAETDLARIVGFEVKPFSVKHEYVGPWSTQLTSCNPHSKQSVVYSNYPQKVEEKMEIIFTYDVEFEEEDLSFY